MYSQFALLPNTEDLLQFFLRQEDLWGSPSLTYVREAIGSPWINYYFNEAISFRKRRTVFLETLQVKIIH